MPRIVDWFRKAFVSSKWEFEVGEQTAGIVEKSGSGA
jgi:hypothetical protein